MQVVEDLAETVNVSTACEALAVPRCAWYRLRQPRLPKPRLPRSTPPRTLSPAERAVVRETLDSQRFQDQAPREVYATLLDEQRYLCSVATMYRVLAENQEVCERRNQLRHPVYAKPELLATGSNQVWSWDITKLLGPVTWTYFFLYVCLDIFSRFVVGWMIAERETADLAQALIAESTARQNIQPNQLTIHADRGGPMIAKPVALLMADLGVVKSHSRPHVSDDNPFSEAQFKTLKYHPTYPDRFGCPADARAWAQPFFRWYNWQHHHTGLGLMTPGAIHYGQAPALRATRAQVLQQAYTAHPERFVRGLPQPPALPTEVWINPPKPAAAGSTATAHVGVDTEVRH